jgi:hypothetical protein
MSALTTMLVTWPSLRLPVRLLVEMSSSSIWHARFFPLSASFGLGEITDGETPMSKLTWPSLRLPVRLLVEMSSRSICQTFGGDG